MYSGHFCLNVDNPHTLNFPLVAASSFLFQALEANFPMKIICAGFPKTGTKSMATALRQLGFAVNDFPEHLHGGLTLIPFPI